MFHTVCYSLMGLWFFYGVAVHAATTEVVVLNSSKQVITNAEALQLGIKGETVYKCTPQIASLNKTGTSIALHAKKKKLTKEEIETQIRELQKRAE